MWCSLYLCCLSSQGIIPNKSLYLFIFISFRFVSFFSILVYLKLTRHVFQLTCILQEVVSFFKRVFKDIFTDVHFVARHSLHVISDEIYMLSNFGDCSWSSALSIKEWENFVYFDYLPTPDSLHRRVRRKVKKKTQANFYIKYNHVTKN